ncbi:MAG TPA: hypothetical protein PLE99_06745 [Candidatus Thiothrix moscowensis]|uniref:hypothetical protein n=1 Tax=unclassified Thiothrix TaxID=2636184 RepID=UPI0025E1DE41|nr:MULTISPECIES: hypothetical protein [unclassified Thiothrix]HRJ52445.1 hypothetical protein [Candidatus Thiothrix moscowensis]HRJ93369.1 hypothetical protein [Candidatus Thiothrix moscowensis]
MNEIYDIRLRQKHWLFGKRELVLRDNDTLTIREQSLFRRDETTIPLDVIQPNPTHASTFSMKWLLNSLFIGSITALLLTWAIQYASVPLYGLSAIFAGTTLVLLYRFTMYTANLVIYRHLQSNENFIYLWKENPNEKDFWQFTNELSRRIALRNN